MKDLTDPRWIHAKGVLFLLIGILASALILLEHPEIQVAVFLALAIWCFCRFYYYAFYVIEKYVDPSYRFSGLGSFARYLLSKPNRRHSSRAESTSFQDTGADRS